MEQETKITLSDKELELVSNTNWILTKHAIIDKVYALFGKEAEWMQSRINNEKDKIPEEAYAMSPKISKGENYKLLPYVILDYPRCFEKEKTLAIRTMFWWGNFFSIHLQLSGEIKEKTLSTIQQSFSSLQQHDFWICIANDPWEHHFEEDNYRPIKEFTAEQFSVMLNSYSFLKIAAKIPVEQWNDTAAFIKQSFLQLINLLKN
ncbi:hypothetical protein [Ferruginibacter albus]|uniref:hypothetical protein n=1 Tax=Ferruginibacter albus TaxID=2875540 RepID=UPI001CC4CC5D|nr:hypothetical protein [Ferruginibacter albus]UAY51627.1 hypothetical protein K9M53_13650 [Ferruginibacter albus]